MTDLARPPAAAKPGRGARRPPRSDPHLRQRYRRRRLAAALVLLVLLVGLGVAARVLLFDSGLVDVEDVRVTGSVAVPVQDVRAAAGVEPGAPLAAVDTGAVATRVARLPGVESVQVGREWPHTVTVELVERVAVAVTQTREGPAPVDRHGVVYHGVPAPGLPRLTFGAAGPADPSTIAATAVLTALPDAVRAQVLTVDVAAAAVGVPGQVSLGLTEGRQVRWGAAERPQDKVSALVPLLTQPGRVYDVTSPDLPTIRR